MTERVRWLKSSYSGGGDGNACVEIASGHTDIRVRDSKAPGRAAITVPATAFTAFVEALKSSTSTS
ncbi:DUF397 domain-containing protein [Streptomyces lienomycini]|uniref:DUF397 domain-containing protein n=1 Tax=Streptomyces lienomycini TaxID=284035 RepID=A0ABV9WZP8_9ACTN|nr:DUF397 domain-containing protein [Streptomyces lienomycini]